MDTNYPLQQKDYVPTHITTTISDYALDEHNKSMHHMEINSNTNPILKQTKSTYEFNNKKDEKDRWDHVDDNFWFRLEPEGLDYIEDVYTPIIFQDDIRKVLKKYEISLDGLPENYSKIVHTNGSEEDNPFAWIYAMIKECEKGEQIKIANL